MSAFLLAVSVLLWKFTSPVVPVPVTPRLEPAPGVEQPVASEPVVESPAKKPSAPPAVPNVPMGDAPLAGIVRDLNGAPVLGATVLAQINGDNLPCDAFEPERLQATTDTEGRFAFPDAPSGRYVVHAATAEAFALQEGLEVLENAAAWCELTLHTAAQVMGRVVDGAGAPISGAAVFPFYSDHWEMETAESLARLSYSDAEGGFTVPSAPGELIQLLACAPGYARGRSEEISAPGKGVIIVLEQGVEVVGSVVEEATAAPVPGLELTLEHRAAVTAGMSAASDTSGAVAWQNVTPGWYEVRLKHDHYVLAEQDLRVEVAAGMPPLTIAVTQGNSIAGHVYRNGEPVSEPMRVVASTSAAGRLEARCDASGAFSLTGLSHGELALQPAALDTFFAIGPERWATLAPGTHLQDFDLEITDIPVRGMVVDEEGAPVPSAEVGASGRKTFTDAGGAFLLRGFMPGASISLVASKGDMVSLPQDVLLSDADGPEIRLILSIVLDGMLAGVTVNAQGTPIPASIQLETGSPGLGLPSKAHWVTTGHSGEFSIKLPTPGTFLLTGGARRGDSTNGQGGALVPQDVSLAKAEQRRDVRIVVPDWPQGLSISGIVVNAKGAPVAHANVSTGGVKPPRRPGGGMANADGAFEIFGLDTGSYDIHASHPGFEPTQVMDVIAGARDVRLVLRGEITVSGVVRDSETGNPVTSFSIALENPLPNRIPERERAKRFFDQEGGFEVPYKPYGDILRIHAEAEGFAPAFVETELPDSRASIEGVEITLEPGEPFEGLVTDIQGVPLGGVTVYQDRLPEYAHDTANVLCTTKPDGTFYLASRPFATPSLFFLKPGYQAAQQSIPETENFISVQLAPGGGVRGTIRRDGAAVVGVDVSSEFGLTTRSGVDGAYAIDGLPPGPEIVRVSGHTAEAFLQQEQAVEIPESGTVELNFDF